MKYFFILITSLSVCVVSAQCKTYRLTTNNDTVNCTDNQGRKQGLWQMSKPALREDPAYTEEGRYKNDEKTGLWKKYSAIGDVLAEENYSWGYKNGISRYYNLMGLLREESWKAVNPENPYDTIKVYDLVDQDRFDYKVIKLEGTTYRNGTWTYYNPERQTIIRTEEYQLDTLLKKPVVKRSIYGDSALTAKDSLAIKNKNMPPEVQQFNQLKGRKKKILVRDGQTGVE